MFKKYTQNKYKDITVCKVKFCVHLLGGGEVEGEKVVNQVT